ncbi:MAG: glycosyltransferase family 39 protein [Pseudomonadota bacterium]
MASVSIIVPTLNEAENMDELLSRISRCCLSQPYDLEVLIVDDASTDNTCDRVEKNQTGLSVRLLRRAGKRGLASAIVDGAAVAAGDIALVMDADLSHPPEAITDLLAPLLNGSCDMAIGSRYIPGGATPDWTLFRKIASRTATLLAWPFCDAKDPMSGFFAVRRDRITELQKSVSGFKIGLELLAAGGDALRVIEVPIEFNDRRRGTSKLGPRIIWEYLHQLWRLAGGNVAPANGFGFIWIGLLGLVTDFSIFELLFSNGVEVGAAHTTSFVAATLINYRLTSRWAFAHGNASDAGSKTRGHLSFLMIALLAVFMRGGVLASLTRISGWPVYAAILGAIGASAGVTYLGRGFLVFPRDVAGNQTSIRWRIFALGVVGYSLLLRCAYLGPPELLHEEAYYWNYAQHLDIGYLDHPPMVAWIIHLGTMVFGNTEFGVRIGAYVCWLVTAFFSFNLTYRNFNTATAFRALILIAALPIFFGVGILMTPDAPLIASWSGTLYFLYRALMDEKRPAWLGAGICLGLGMLSKYTIALLGPATLLFLLIDRRSRHWFLKPNPYLAAGIALALFSPVIIWNFHHEWASFMFQGPQRIADKFSFSLHELVASVLFLLTPTGFAAAFSILIFKKECQANFHLRDSGYSGMPVTKGRPTRFSKPSRYFETNSSGISEISSTHHTTHSKSRAFTFALVFMLVPLSVFLTFSLSKSIKLNWTGPLWLSLIPFIAHYMAPDTGSLSPRLFRLVQRAWPVTIAASLLFYGASLHYLSLGLPGLSYPNNFPLVGCRDLGRQIERIEDDLELTSGEEPLVVGMDKYRIASLLAFYRPEMALSDKSAPKESVTGTAGCHLFGGNSLMYRYWFPEKTNENRVMILVGSKRSDLEGSNIPSRVREMGTIQKLVVRKNGKPVGNYFYVLVKGYTEGRNLPAIKSESSGISDSANEYGNHAVSLAGSRTIPRGK